MTDRSLARTSACFAAALAALPLACEVDELDDDRLRVVPVPGDGDGDPHDDPCPDEIISETELPITRSGSTIGAGDGPAPPCTFDNLAPDVTHVWTVPEDGRYDFDTAGSAFDTVLTVYAGVCERRLALDCDDDGLGESLASWIQLSLTAGQDLTVVVDGFSQSSQGDYNLNIDRVVCPPPTDIGSTVPDQHVGSIAPGPSVLRGSCGGRGPEAALLWTAPAAGVYTFDTIGSSFDALLYLIDGDTCSGPELGCNDDSFELQSEVTVALAAGQAVYVVVDNFSLDGSGDYVLNVSPA